MNVVILGDGEEEQAWASWFASQADYVVKAIYPDTFHLELPDAHAARDLEEALATPGLGLVLVGGPIADRSESLRRAAAEGLAILCLHPPGADSEPYYQVALSRMETGALVLPDLPFRLHPGVRRMKEAMRDEELGAFRGIRHEFHLSATGRDLAREVFPNCVDVIRALLGEMESLTASGDPPGQRPDLELVVQLRAVEGRRAEVRIEGGTGASACLLLNGALGSLTLDYDPLAREPARLVRRSAVTGAETEIAIDGWDPHAAMMQALVAAVGRAAPPPRGIPAPSLQDGTRAMELTEAVVRSLRRSRTIDLHYEAISEEASFKSIMTSTGCAILLGILFLLPIALAGPALGQSWTIYLSWLIPPVLVLFAVVQVLRFGIRKDDARDARGGNPPPKEPVTDAEGELGPG